MPIVQLQITSPASDAVVIGAAPLALRGSVMSSGHPQLFFKWYSSLNAPQDASQAALNWSNLAALSFDTPLDVGSHVITLSAKDRAGDAQPDIEAVQHAGMAGGPPEPGLPSPCVVHVLRASLLAPAAGAALSRAGATLEAVAPSKWGKGDYAPVNRVRYRWMFTPVGAPGGRASADLLPPLASLSYVQPASQGDPHRLRYTGPLPAALGAGRYAIRLRVELFEREGDPARTSQFHDDPAGAREVTLI
jgi:hypothetical protein